MIVDKMLSWWLPIDAVALGSILLANITHTLDILGAARQSSEDLQTLILTQITVRIRRRRFHVIEGGLTQKVLQRSAVETLH